MRVYRSVPAVPCRLCLCVCARASWPKPMSVWILGFWIMVDNRLSCLKHDPERLYAMVAVDSISTQTPP